MRKLLIVIATALALNSCNTTIGLYRDTTAGVIWTIDKIKGNNNY